MDINKELEAINVDIDFQDRCDILYKLICDDFPRETEIIFTRY